MELRHYWRVLVRRRTAVRNTFVLVAVLAIVSVAYSYYTSRYLARTEIGVQVQPNPNLSGKGVVIDPQQAADANTGPVEDDLQSYAGTTKYFKLVSAELQHRYGINMDWKAVSTGLKVFAASTGHSLIIEWPSSTEARGVTIVSAAADQLIAYVPYYHKTLRPLSPPIATSYVDPPNARREGLNKPVLDAALRLALGLVAGIVVAYLVEYLDDTVQDESDVQRWVGLPTLGVIPGGRQVRRARSA